MATKERVTRCVICGRLVGNGDLPIGRVCKSRLRSVDVSDAKPFQIDKALDLIVDRAIVRTRIRYVLPVFRCTSSDGARTYLVVPTACTCPAGLVGQLCYHRIAARMLASA